MDDAVQQRISEVSSLPEVAVYERALQGVKEAIEEDKRPGTVTETKREWKRRLFFGKERLVESTVERERSAMISDQGALTILDDFVVDIDKALAKVEKWKVSLKVSDREKRKEIVFKSVNGQRELSDEAEQQRILKEAQQIVDPLSNFPTDPLAGDKAVLSLSGLFAVLRSCLIHNPPEDGNTLNLLDSKHLVPFQSATHEALKVLLEAIESRQPGLEVFSRMATVGIALPPKIFNRVDDANWLLRIDADQEGQEHADSIFQDLFRDPSFVKLLADKTLEVGNGHTSKENIDNLSDSWTRLASNPTQENLENHIEKIEAGLAGSGRGMYGSERASAKKLNGFTKLLAAARKGSVTFLPAEETPQDVVSPPVFVEEPQPQPGTETRTTSLPQGTAEAAQTTSTKNRL